MEMCRHVYSIKRWAQVQYLCVLFIFFLLIKIASGIAKFMIAFLVFFSAQVFTQIGFIKYTTARTKFQIPVCQFHNFCMSTTCFMFSRHYKSSVAIVIRAIFIYFTWVFKQFQRLQTSFSLNKNSGKKTTIIQLKILINQCSPVPEFVAINNCIE